MRAIFLSGLLSAVLNPKPGLFVLAFIPQFVSPTRGDASVQMLIYGAWFALLTTVVFALMGAFASRLAGLLQARPRVVAGLNIGAGSAFVAAGLSVATLSNK